MGILAGVLPAASVLPAVSMLLGLLALHRTN